MNDLRDLKKMTVHGHAPGASTDPKTRPQVSQPTTLQKTGAARGQAHPRGPARAVGLTRKVSVKLPVKRNSNFHDARPVHLIIKMIKWVRNRRLAIKNSLSLWGCIGRTNS